MNQHTSHHRPLKSSGALPVINPPPLPPPASFELFAYNPHVHIFDSEGGPHAYVANQSQVFSIPASLAARLSDQTDFACDPRELLSQVGISSFANSAGDAATTSPIRSLSLAVAQKCNLSCGYCYAQEGSFGGPVASMSPDVARAAVNRLLATAMPGDKCHLIFLGGEPLLARDVLRMTTEFAAELAELRRVAIGFSITSNGTLITPDDGDFFEKHRFSVTISLDGLGSVHDRLRPFKSGAGTFDRIMSNIQPLLEQQGEMQVSARVTVTPRNLNLADTLVGLIDRGFHSVGFSPMLTSPTGVDQMDWSHLQVMLEQMIICGKEFERHVRGGIRFPFSNMMAAMEEIHRGSSRPYPCGAGISYYGVSAEGELSACHRFVGDAKGSMGNIATGVDASLQRQWMTERHVDSQEPCRSCWARYLCGGGCHHEVLHRGRPSCDYIRGWLHYSLQAYIRLLSHVPDYFSRDR
ncbi:radical SAM/SPASM domain-containing protein [Lacipirellula parvula]|uniref:Arylsulfatase regulator n=1 Tax=Lacipirellula parvula TaxID=2650471 RepID=A0A5K7XFE6_9BACT|nr:SPASM domain-containing protein [Lacipirellula parvula]BBO35594.1 arylsulfatase regulator [Lacipirellula parvula]